MKCRSAPSSTALSGFGVIELMVGLAIVAILMSLGAGSYGSITGKARVAADASDLLHAIELTRAEAMKRAARVTLAPADGDWTSGWVVFVDTNVNRRFDADEPLVHRHPPLARTTRLTNDTTPGYVAFGGQGRPLQYSGAFLAGTIALCDAGVKKSIVLAKSGRPRLQTASC